jgi:hypothetical protein
VSLKAGSAFRGEREELMPYRIFQDSTGNEWQVWDVVPQLTERRRGEADRRVEIAPVAFADRRRDERRLSYAHRAVLRGAYAHGWLCFDNGAAKRRLSPIPPDWTTCDDDTLEAYLRAGDPVKQGRPSFDAGAGGDSLAEAG